MKHYPSPKLRRKGKFNWILTEDYTIYGTVVPKGFETDGLSFIDKLIPRIGNHFDGPVVAHDWFYDCLRRGQPDPVAPTREKADKAFRDLLEDCGVSWTFRTAMYLAVRLFGGSSFIKSLVIK